MTEGDRSHQDLQELLGAHALDALAADEAAVVEAHVAWCPVCRGELDSHRAMAAAMGTDSRGSGAAMPASLWDRIAAEIGSPAPGRMEPHGAGQDRGELVQGTAVPGGAPGSLQLVDAGAPGRAPGRADHWPAGRRAHRRSRWAAAAAVVTAAAAAIVLLAVSLGSVDGRVGRLQAALAGRGVDAGVAAALADPAHLDATMRSASGRAVGEAVVAGGHGYLVGAHMAVLPASKTYQLWAVVDGKPVSVGVLGNTVTDAAFTMGTLSPQALAVTVEPARGSVVPTTAPVATARI